MKTSNRTYHKPLFAVIGLLLITVIAFDFPGNLNAQNQKKKQPAQQKDQKQQKEKTNPEAADDEKEKIVEEFATEGTDPSDYVYQPKGRRDPFWNLLQGKNVRLKREAKEGIAGLLVDELELEGIITKDGQNIALFKGPDGRPYDVRTGDYVYDGEVLDITPNAVVFKRTLTTTVLGGTKERLITKRLVPDEEAAKK